MTRHNETLNFVSFQCVCNSIFSDQNECYCKYKSIALRDMVKIPMKNRDILDDRKLDKNSYTNLKLTSVYGRGDTKEIRAVPCKRSENMDFKNVNITDVVKTQLANQLKNEKKQENCLQRNVPTSWDEGIASTNNHQFKRTRNGAKLLKSTEVDQRIAGLKKCTMHRNMQPSIHIQYQENLNKLLNCLEQANDNVTRNKINNDIKEEKQKSNFNFNLAVKGALKIFFKKYLSALTCKKLKLKYHLSSLQCKYRNKRNTVIDISDSSNNSDDSRKEIINTKDLNSEISPERYHNKGVVRFYKSHGIASSVSKDVEVIDITMDKSISNKAPRIGEKTKMSSYFNGNLDCYFVHLKMDYKKGLCVGVPEKTETKVDMLRHNHCKCRQNSSSERWKQPSNVDQKSLHNKLKFLRIFKRQKIIVPSNNIKSINEKSESNCQYSNIRNDTNSIGIRNCISQNGKTLESTCAPVKSIVAFNKPNLISKVITAIRNVLKNNNNFEIRNTDHKKCEETLCEIKIDTTNKLILNKHEVKRKLKPVRKGKKRCLTKADLKNNLNINLCNTDQKEKEKCFSKNEVLPRPSTCKGPLFEVKLDPYNMRILNFSEITQKIRDCQRAELVLNSINHNLLTENRDNTLNSDTKYLRRVQSKISCLWTQILCKCDSKSQNEKSKYSRHGNVKHCTAIPERKDRKKYFGTRPRACNEIGNGKKQKKKREKHCKKCKTKNSLKVNHKCKKNSTLCMKNLTKKQRMQSRSKRRCKSKINRTRNVLQLFQMIFKIRSLPVYSPSVCNCFTLDRRGSIKGKYIKRGQTGKEETYNSNSFFPLWHNKRTRKRHNDCGEKYNIYNAETVREQRKPLKRKRHKRHDQISNCCQYAHLKNTRKPCLWLYIICPSLYPSYLAMKAILLGIARFMFVIMVLVSWFPCVVALEMLRVCCYL